MEKHYLPTRLEELGSGSIDTIEAPCDFRNFSVVKGDGNDAGRVTDLLFDIESKKTRYLILSLHASGRKILVPVGLAEINEESKAITVSALSDNLIEALPDYHPGEINPGVENIIRLAYSRESETSGLTGNDTLQEEEHFYNHFHFDLSRIFANKKKVNEIKKVSAVFDDSLEAETAVSQLLMNGFSQDNIEISGKKEEQMPEETEVRPSAGALVEVTARNSEEALKASEILDRNGSINVFEGFN